MAKRIDKPIPEPRADGPGDDDLVAARLRRHLHFLGLSHTLDQLDAHLVWATRERPGATALLEHLLGAEAAHKLEQRISRRIDTSGLVERKALEVFDWDFQPGVDKALILELARLDFVRSTQARSGCLARRTSTASPRRRPCARLACPPHRRTRAGSHCLVHRPSTASPRHRPWRHCLKITSRAQGGGSLCVRRKRLPHRRHGLS